VSELRVRLKARRNSKHPWIYLKMCEPAPHPPGSLVEVVDASGGFVGRGIYNRKSQIAVRLLTEKENEPLDEAFFARALDRAIAFRRRRLDLDRTTSAYRVVNAEGDGLSGLVVDRFASFVVVQLFSAGWFRLLRWLLPALGERFPGSTVLVKADEIVEEREGFHVQDFTAARLGDERLKTVVRESDVAYHVDLRHGHKTGFFCDQRENRLRVRDLSRGAHVLDCFSYTGGFALNAAKGGAASVTAVDLDEKAVALARRNAEANRLRVDFRHADAFDALRDARAAGRAFDLVVLDPPKFAAGKKEVEPALRRYRDVNELALGVVRDRGTLVTCSCSGAVSEARFRATVEAAAARAGAALELRDVAGAAADHPVRAEFPEGRYLKVLTYTVRRGVAPRSPARARSGR
jgi:23S rRNA (cytosine1962-C5)-methyltransferase